jgi:hypothetical protein
LKRWTGLRSAYSPAASKTKKAKPNTTEVICFDKHPTNAKYNKPTKNPIKKDNLMMLYPYVSDSLVPNSALLKSDSLRDSSVGEQNAPILLISGLVS